MSIRQISIGRWQIDAAVKMAGKVKRKRTVFTGKKTEAKEKWVETKKELRKENSTHSSLKYPECRTFGNCLARYAQSNGHKWDSYRIERLQNELGEVPLDCLAERFARYIDLVRTQRTVKGALPRPATLNKLITLAKSAVGYCVRLGLIERNSLQNYKKFDEMNERDRIIEEMEFTRLYNCLPVHLKPISLFAYQIPTRRGELVKLRREDVDVINRIVLLRAENTKTKKARRLPIPENMFEYFESIPALCPWAFYREKRMGKQVYYSPLSTFQSSWKWACKKAGISEFRFHDFRRVAGSNLARKGVPESVIKYLGGWRTDIFFKRYRHIELEELKRAVNRTEVCSGDERKVSTKVSTFAG